MKKGDSKLLEHDNSNGVVAVVLAILGITLSFYRGLAISIIALAFAFRQHSINPNKWSKRGIILAIVGIITSFLIIAFNIWAGYYYVD